LFGFSWTEHSPFRIFYNVSQWGKKGKEKNKSKEKKRKNQKANNAKVQKTKKIRGVQCRATREKHEYRQK
jgi:hypothetical protein